MNNIFGVFLVLAVLTFAWTYSAVTPSVQCEGENFDNLRDRIEVLPCGKTRCKLRKGTNITVNFKFNPKKEVKALSNYVFARIAGIPVPFIGVDGTSACANVRNDDGTPAKCPLAPGKEYLYTNVIPVQQFYPSVTITVHWALNDGKSDVICFEVPAVIA